METRERPKLGWHAAIVAGAVVTLVVTGLAVRGQHVSSFERHVFRVINGFPAILEGPVWLVMQLGNGLMVVAAPLVAALCRRYRLAVVLALTGGAAYLVARFIKDIVVRPRPAALLHDVHLRPGSTAQGHGFPSGHAAVAFSLATALCLMIGPRLRPYAMALILLGAAIVGFGRVYVGAHFPFDVVGGAAIGIIVGIVVVTANHSVETPDTRSRRLWQ